MRVRLTILLATLCMLVWTSPAQTRMAAQCSQGQPAKQELKCGTMNLYHANGALRFLHSHPHAGTKQSRNELYRGMIWLKKYARSHIAMAQSKMIPLIPHRSAWLCIHGYEGSWTDSGDPYWGGLQMDRGFMATYGSDFERRFHGFANVWPIWAQMEAAERAYRSRGFYPWPNTARYCGLL